MYDISQLLGRSMYVYKNNWHTFLAIGWRGCAHIKQDRGCTKTGSEQPSEKPYRSKSRRTVRYCTVICWVQAMRKKRFSLFIKWRHTISCSCLVKNLSASRSYTWFVWQSLSRRGEVIPTKRRTHWLSWVRWTLLIVCKVPAAVILFITLNNFIRPANPLCMLAWSRTRA